MPRNYRTLLPLAQASPFVLQGLRSESIVEPAVPVSLNGQHVGKFQGLEIFEKGQSGCPQTVADLISNTYLRLTYKTASGTSATFGTSVVGAISFRQKGEQLSLIPTVLRAEVEIDTSAFLKVSVFGAYGSLAEITSERIYSINALSHLTSVKVRSSFTAIEDIELEQTFLRNDAFRLFTLSSMYAASIRYDGNLLRWGNRSLEAQLDLRTQERRARYIFNAPESATQISIAKEIGSLGQAHTPGSPDSPSIEALTTKCSLPDRELATQAYLAPSTDINDDSLSMWLEWTKAPPVIQRGYRLFWEGQFSALMLPQGVGGKLQ